MSTAKPLAYHELSKVLAAPPDFGHQLCPVCRLVTASVHHFLDGFIYSLTTDPEVRGKVRQARGFCNEHAGELQQITGVGLGVALINCDVLDTVLEEIARSAGRAAPGIAGTLTGLLRRRAGVTRLVARLRAPLRPRRQCIACTQQKIAEETYLTTLLRNLDDNALCTAFRTSPGLCLPHFDQALGLARDAQTLSALVDLETGCLARLRDDLAELARKYDYNFRHELLGAERDAWLRSLDQIAGKRGIR